MHWLRPPKRPASRSNALTFARSWCERACAGVTPTGGELLTTRTRVRNRAGGRHPLHPATRRVDDESRTDELGPVMPRTFAPAPGWSANGHRIKAELEYGRGPEKTWVYGADAEYVMARS